MTEPIEFTYFDWLCSKVMRVEASTPSTTFWGLFRYLHNHQYVWTISGDDNRAADGVDLRHEYAYECNVLIPREWENLPCSVFEMLVALAIRAQFQTGDPPSYWFWIMMENLGLDECNDASIMQDEEVEEIVQRFLFRQYEPSGLGGLFPLHDPLHDQRTTEIWYQFAEYITDHNLPI